MLRASALPQNPAGFGNQIARINLLRSVPFRLVMGFSLLYLACFAISGLIFYEILQGRLRDRIDASIMERHVAVREVYEEQGLDAVLKLAHSRDDIPMRYNLGFHLATADGIRVAGNVPTCITAPGWANLSGGDLGLNNNDQYRFRTVFLGDNLLSLGKSLYSLEDVRATAIHSFLWTVLASLLFAVLGAIFIAYRAHQRIERIACAMDLVATGNLDARLPISPRCDDIDQLSVKINDALARFKQMVDSMRQVSTDIAHDLKTPLNRLFIQIEGAAEATRQGKCVDTELMQALEEATSINATFEALLRIAQIEAGARRSQFRSIELQDVLETAAEVYAPVIEEHNQHLHLLIKQGERLAMFGDRELLLQLVVNLIENAIRHCPDNTRITIEAGQDATGVWLSVADNGPGVAEEHRQKVFQRLYRLESSRTTEGTGLGLSLVKAIADLHCGSIELSDNNPGLKITILFARDCDAC
jgi:signal transduction histidine kinase